MQIQLKEKELKCAVTDYIKKLGITRDIEDIDFTATRGSDGIITEVTISDESNVASSIPSHPVVRAVEETSAPKVEDTLPDLPDGDDENESIFG